MHNWSTTAKFFSIKLVLIIEIIQDIIIEKVVTAKDEEGDIGYVGKHGCPLEGHNRSVYWGMWFLTFETMLMVFLMRIAFPAEEIKEDQHEVEVTDLDLYRHNNESNNVA